MTLGPIIITERPDLPEVICHEMVHVEQYKKYPLTFLIKYWYYNWKYGYDKNPFEVEAYALEDRVKKLSLVA